jgi:hypothetical protein
MSDTIGSGSTVGGSVPAGSPVSSAHNVTEAYAFACMHCGHGWEQAYEIEHHTDLAGHAFVTYLADGAQVPSPLTRPSCRNCDGHLVRIMRSGQVSDAIASRWRVPRTEPVARAERAPHRAHHWSVLNFLHRDHGESGPV